MNIETLLTSYDLHHLTVGVLGGHSALDVCHGAKAHGFSTVAVARKGREKTYTQYFKTRGKVGCVDDVIVVEQFENILREDIQEKLRAMNTLFVHNRYFWTYFEDFSDIEKTFHVPIVGSRHLLRLEERDQPYTQYDLLRDAGIRTPRIIPSPDHMDMQLCIIKVNEAARGYERAFFLANRNTYATQAGALLKSGAITEKALQKAVIEEFIIGAPVNFNFFYSPLTTSLELLGTDTRRQTNLDGLLRLPAWQQNAIKDMLPVKMIETGHVAVTVKESLLEKAFDLGEKFVAATQKLPKTIDPSGRGIIGPFALQGAVVAEEGREDIVIFDVSLRIPGSPGLNATPYSGYLYGRSMSVGERLGLELRMAVEEGLIEKIIT